MDASKLVSLNIKYYFHLYFFGASLLAHICVTLCLFVENYHSLSDH